MIDSIVRNLVSEAFDKELGVKIEVEKIALSATKKEFEGDFTLVVFPFMQMCGLKNPVELANKLGAYVVSQTQWIESFNVIKGFLNFVVADSYWQNLPKLYD